MLHLREDETGLLLTDDLEIHFLELPCLEYGAYSLEDNLVKWLLFIKGTELLIKVIHTLESAGIEYMLFPAYKASPV